LAGLKTIQITVKKIKDKIKKKICKKNKRGYTYFIIRIGNRKTGA
jgi:hypothetical protein